MPHRRNRWIYSKARKKLELSPVFILQGARQTGKSFLAREEIAAKFKNSYYVTLDINDQKVNAQNSPGTFLEEHKENRPFIIDEAQKAPQLFDEIKAIVDIKKTPGQFVLLGSTEFSHLTNIRESLTGRISRGTLFPLTVGETLSLDFSGFRFDKLSTLKPRCNRLDVLQYLRKGGMPGIFTIRDKLQFKDSIKDWIALTCERDIYQLHKLKLDPTLTYQILEAIALVEEPTISEISKTLKVSNLKVTDHIKGLKGLFVINEILPYSAGIGKPRYYLIDSAFADFFGAKKERILQTWIYNEILSTLACDINSKYSLFYYRSAKGKSLPVILEETLAKNGLKSLPIGIDIITEEIFSNKELDTLLAFKKRTNGEILAIGPFSSKMMSRGVRLMPFEMVV